MINTKNVLALIGLALAILGAVLSYTNAPKFESRIDGGGPSTDFDAIEREVALRNSRAMAGVAIALAGSILLFIAGYL